MAGRNHDAAAAVKLPHGKGQHGRGGKLVIDIDVYARVRQRGGADLGVQPGVVARIIADGAALGQLGARQPFGKSLRRAAHGELIEAVAAQPHNAADTRRAKGQLRAEAALERLLVVLHGGQCRRVFRRGVGAPKCILFFVIHTLPPSYCHIQIRLFLPYRPETAAFGGFLPRQRAVRKPAFPP